MTQLDQQRKQIEEEIRKGVRPSTTSLLSSNTSVEHTESCELVTVQDYQSAPGSRLQTETLPTKRGASPPSKGHHIGTFSKTQNIKDILRGLNDCLSGGGSDLESVSNSLLVDTDLHKSQILRIIEKQQRQAA